MNKRLLILCGVVVLLFIIAGAMAIRPRSDEWYAQYLQGHRREMEELVTLFRTNQFSTVMRRFDRKDVLMQWTDKVVTEVTSLSSNGAILYRLFDSIGCDYASQAEGEIMILLPRHGWEDLYPGGYKAFVFRQSSPQLLVESIDEHRRRNRGQYRFYCPLEGSWFLKYEEAH